MGVCTQLYVPDLQRRVSETPACSGHTVRTGACCWLISVIGEQVFED